MAMTRTQLRQQAEIARFKAAKNKPLERRRVQAFMAQITRAVAQILGGDLLNIRSVQGSPPNHLTKP